MKSHRKCIPGKPLFRLEGKTDAEDTVVYLPSGVPNIGRFFRVCGQGSPQRTVEQGCESVRALKKGSIFGKPQATPAGKAFFASFVALQKGLARGHD
jgi:hypothetical protein